MSNLDWNQILDIRLGRIQPRQAVEMLLRERDGIGTDEIHRLREKVDDLEENNIELKQFIEQDAPEHMRRREELLDLPKAGVIWG